jgi:predicted DsbA family dithiol-disulfide isomerase
MMEGPARFFFDYVDPLSLLVERDLAALEAEGMPALVRHPLELRAPPARLIDPEDPLWTRRWEQARQLGEARGIRMRPPALVPWSRKAHELAQHAREMGMFEEVHLALFRAFLEEGRDIGRIDVLATVAREAGLDGQDARTVLGVDRYAAGLDGLRGEAERLGVRGVPTLLLWGDRIEGVLPPEALRAVLAREPEAPGGPA